MFEPIKKWLTNKKSISLSDVETLTAFISGYNSAVSTGTTLYGTPVSVLQNKTPLEILFDELPIKFIRNEIEFNMTSEGVEIIYNDMILRKWISSKSVIFCFFEKQEQRALSEIDHHILLYSFIENKEVEWYAPAGINRGISSSVNKY